MDGIPPQQPPPPPPIDLPPLIQVDECEPLPHPTGVSHLGLASYFIMPLWTGVQLPPLSERSVSPANGENPER